MAQSNTVIVRRAASTRRGWTAQYYRGVNGWTRVGQGHFATKAAALVAAEVFIAGFRDKYGVELALVVA